MRQIKASAVKPGMTIGWSQLGIKYTCVVSSIEPDRSQISQEIMASGGGEATLYNNTMVTVLAEPKPEEPTAFGARVVADGFSAVRLYDGEDEIDPENPPWRVRIGRDRWRDMLWHELVEDTEVTVVPDHGWTVPADGEPTPEVPDRIEEWPENDEHLKDHKWRDERGAIWSSWSGKWGCQVYGKRWRPPVGVTRPFDGPWTRVTDA